MYRHSLPWGLHRPSWAKSGPAPCLLLTKERNHGRPADGHFVIWKHEQMAFKMALARRPREDLRIVCVLDAGRTSPAVEAEPKWKSLYK